jgi:hypothetical protein
LAVLEAIVMSMELRFNPNALYAPLMNHRNWSEVWSRTSAI